MTSMSLYWKTLGLLFAVACVLYKTCLSAKTSKACYGSQGLPCTKHTLECSSEMIAIQDAYYTNSTACTASGLSSCNINISSIPDTGRYQNFSETQLDNLNKNCSGRQNCTFNSVRNGTTTFSIVKYICINGDSSVSCSKSTTTHSTDSAGSETTTTETSTTVARTTETSTTAATSTAATSIAATTTEATTTEATTTDATTTDATTTDATVGERKGSGTGRVVGGAVAAVVVIGAVVALVFWFKYKRNKTPRVKKGKQGDSYSEVNVVSKKAKNKEVNTNSRGNYDYATINDDIKIRHVGTDNYDLARTPVGNIMPQNGEAKIIEEGEYNHLDDQKQTILNGDKPSGYDTTASAAAAVRKLENKSSSNREDDYDYNHLSDNSDVKPTKSDYDTAGSASRAVAQMVKDKDTPEDDYDHFHKTEIKSLDSPYDTTEPCVNETDSSLTGTENKNDPYDLAK